MDIGDKYKVFDADGVVDIQLSIDEGQADQSFIFHRPQVNLSIYEGK